MLLKLPLLYLGLASAALFLSGASTLTYEILWQRQLYLIFGASAPAITAILTAIFLGIALGSRAARGIAERTVQPAKVYAGLELAIGVWGAIVPWLFQLSERLYVALAADLGEQSPSLQVLRFVLAVLPLLPATLAMGATVPVMIKTVSGPDKSNVAWAYGINIFGATAGCLLTGLVWIRTLGLSQTRFIAVGLNVVAFLLLISLKRFAAPRAAPARLPTEAREFTRPYWLGATYFFAGFVALGLEVVWLRFLGIVNSNSTVTFTLTLVIYLLGMGLGSLVGYPLVRRWWSAGAVFVLANLGVAVSALLTYWMLYQAMHVNHEYITLPSIEGTLSLAHILRAEGINTASLVLLPTFFMGLVYPAVCDLGAKEGSHSDSWNAISYFIGTLGSVAGILIVGTLMIPRLGLHGCLSALIALSVIAGCVCHWNRYPKSRYVTLLLGAFLCFWAGSYSLNPRPVLRNTIARQEAGTWVEYSLSESERPLSELVHIKAGSTATVTIKKAPGKDEHFVYVDDQLVASTNLEAKVDAHMLAHLPLLLHPDPQNALTVGFGSGGTSHAMTTHEIDTFCVEIEREVTEAAPFLDSQNFDVLNHPRFSLIINDARDHLHVTTRRYDVISTDVTNLQYKQNSSLYTVEYFELMKKCLREDGIACAWIPMASISTEELRTLMNSFREVFPHATLWFMNHTHSNFGILIGTPGLLRIDFARLESGFSDREIAENLRMVGLTDPLQLVHCLHLDEPGYQAFCQGAELHTDDFPVLEFTSPLSFYQYYETFRDNLALTLEHRPESIRQYVANLPDDVDQEWEKHAVASSCFCYALLESYNFIVFRARGNREAAFAAAARAIRFAKKGLAAYPEDSAREEFYDRVLREAFHAVESPPR